MKNSKNAILIFLRFALGLGFLSASMDRLGLWNGILSESQIAWGNWDSFIDYTYSLIPWAGKLMANIAGVIATIAEILFGVFLIIGFKVKLFATLSGILLLLFALAMFIQNIKSPFDMSVFTASAASFALAYIQSKYKRSQF